MPAASEPFTPATTILKLSKVPNAISARGAALRRIGVDVVELLEAGGIFQVAEQRQAVLPCQRWRGPLRRRRGRARQAIQRERGRGQRRGAGLQEGSAGEAHAMLRAA